MTSTCGQDRQLVYWLVFLVSCALLLKVRPVGCQLPCPSQLYIQPLSAASGEARASVGPTELESKQVAENKGQTSGAIWMWGGM